MIQNVTIPKSSPTFPIHPHMIAQLCGRVSHDGSTMSTRKWIDDHPLGPIGSHVIMVYIYLPRKLGHIKWAKCWDKNIPAPWVAYGLFEHLRTGYAMYAIPPKSCLKNFAISEMLRAQMPCSHLRIETHVLGRNRAHKKIWLPVGMKTKTERRLGSIITK